MIVGKLIVGKRRNLFWLGQYNTRQDSHPDCVIGSGLWIGIVLLVQRLGDGADPGVAEPHAEKRSRLEIDRRVVHNLCISRAIAACSRKLSRRGG